MNRTTVAALAAVAVVGAMGGGLTAMIRGNDGRADTPAASGSTPPPSRVLYAGAKVIHDGDARVTYAAPFDTPDRLVRAASGYVISHDTSPQEARSAVFHVATDGTTTKIAEILGRFDLDASGRRLVASDLRSGTTKVWSLDGTVVASWADGPTGGIRPVWAGDVVLSSTLHNTAPASGDWRMWRWNPDTGASRRLDTVGFADMGASADGRLLSGSVGIDGHSVVEENYCLGVTTVPSAAEGAHWDTCDWRLNGGGSDAFNASGTHILAVPSDSDGFGPGQFGTFSATSGPVADLHTFLTPPLTMDATWLGDDRLLLIGATDMNLDAGTGRWIKSCDLAGKCTDVTTREHGELVLGEQA